MIISKAESMQTVQIAESEQNYGFPQTFKTSQFHKMQS